MDGELVTLWFPEQVVRVREPDGQAQLAVTGASLRDALDLLRSVARTEDAPAGEDGALDVAAVATCDRHRLLAAVHRCTFGDKIESTVGCATCKEPFDLSFSLSALERGVADERRPGAGELLDVPGVGRLRVPTGVDELALAGLDPEEALRTVRSRCLDEPLDDAEGGPDEAEVGELLDAALGRVAPLLDLDLDATCPECGSAQTVRFEIQAYLLRSLMADRARLLLDVHRLASAYRWSRAEVLAMRRGERRALVDLVEGDVGAAQRSLR